MKHTARKRIIIAAVLMAVLLAGGVSEIFVGAKRGPFGPLGASAALGASGDRAPPPTLGHSGQGTDTALGHSGPQTAAATTASVKTFAELRSAISGSTGDLYIYLDASLSWSGGAVPVDQNRNITVDGRNTYQIDQVSSDENWNFQTRAGATMTLKDLTFVGRTQFGAIRSTGASSKGIFDNVAYTGPQVYYGHGGDNEMIVRNGGSFEIKRQTGTSAAPEEFNECARVTFDGGKTTIRHALSDNNTNAVFFMVNGTSGTGSIQLVNGADVSVETGDYVLYTGIGAIDYMLESSTRLDITAPAFNRGADGHYHPVGAFTMGESSYYSYQQRGTSNLGGPFKAMYINGDVTVGKDATFLIDTTTYGLWLRGSRTFTANEPRLVSIHGGVAAFTSLEGLVSGTWQVNGVNAVNFWTSTRGAPALDAATNWPDHIWNTWAATGNGAYSIGEPFSFAATGPGGVTLGGETLSDALGRSEKTLNNTLKFNTSAKRVAFGNIAPFVVDQVQIASGAIEGTVDSTDLMADYTGKEGGKVRLTGVSLPLPFSESTLPEPGGRVTVVANLQGLRAAVMADVFGALQLVSAPQRICFGTHDLPPVTTVFKREYTSSADAQGRMLVRVEDTRGDMGGAWELKVEAVEAEIPGKKSLPPSALIFRTGSNREYSLANGAVAVHRQAMAEDGYAQYDIAWDDDHGLLARLAPGELEPGSYAAVLGWSVHIVPDEE